MALGPLEHWWLRRHLSAYADGALGPSQQRRLAGHLARCPACQQELTELQATARALARLPQAPLPRPFRLSAAQALPAAPGPGPALRLLPGMAVACSLLLAALLAYDVVRPTSGPSAPGLEAARPAAPQEVPAQGRSPAIAVTPSPAPIPALPFRSEEATPPSPPEAAPPPRPVAGGGGPSPLRLAQVGAAAAALAAAGAWGALALRARRRL
jgi:hypothetical protein